LNLPNTLTFSRFLLIPLYIYVFFSNSPHNELFAYCVLLLAGITDMLDGFIARKYNLVSEVGIMLDPLADKLMMLTVILSFLLIGRIDWIIALAIFVRDMGMIVSSIILHWQGKKTVPANIWGKLTTVLYYLVILFVMFEAPYYLTFLWGVVIFSFIVSFLYLNEYQRLNRY